MSFLEKGDIGPSGSSTDPIYIQNQDTSWKGNVGTVGDLPLVGNTDGDKRTTVDNGNIYAWYGAAWHNKTSGGGGGASAFTDLTDAPSSYTGQGGKFVAVKVTEDGLEFVTETTSSITVVSGKEENVSSITKGQVIAIHGSSGNKMLFAKGDNTDPVHIRTIGLAQSNISQNSNGTCQTSGKLTGVDTRTSSTAINPLGQTWSPGNLLFAVTGGGMSNVRPTSGRIVKVGFCLYGNTLNDEILINIEVNPVWLTSAVGEDVVNRLGDSDGDNKLSIRNYDNDEVASIDSNGCAVVECLDVNNADSGEVNFRNPANTDGTVSGFNLGTGSGWRIYFRTCQGQGWFEIADGSGEVQHRWDAKDYLLSSIGRIGASSETNYLSPEMDAMDVAFQRHGIGEWEINSGLSGDLRDLFLRTMTAIGAIYIEGTNALILGTNGSTRLWDDGSSANLITNDETDRDLNITTGVNNKVNLDGNLNVGGFLTGGYHNHSTGFEDVPVQVDGTGSYTMNANECWFYTDATKDTTELHTIAASGTFTPSDPITGDSSVTYCCADRDTDSWVELSYFPDSTQTRYKAAYRVVKRLSSANLHHKPVYELSHGALEAITDCEMATSENKVSSDALRNLACDSSLHITLGGGVVYILGRIPLDILPVTSATRLFKCFETTPGTWSIASATNPTLDNTHWNDTSSGLVLMTDTYWAEAWLFRGIEDQDHLYYIYGTAQYSSSDLAMANNVRPAEPELITSHTQFVGRIIFEKSATTGFICQSAFDTVFIASSAAPTALSVVNTPAGNITSLNVQGALNELDTMKVQQIGCIATINRTSNIVQLIVDGNILQEWEIGGDLI